MNEIFNFILKNKQRAQIRPISYARLYKGFIDYKLITSGAIVKHTMSMTVVFI